MAEYGFFYGSGGNGLSISYSGVLYIYRALGKIKQGREMPELPTKYLTLAELAGENRHSFV